LKEEENNHQQQGNFESLEIKRGIEEEVRSNSVRLRTELKERRSAVPFTPLSLLTPLGQLSLLHL